MSLFDNLKKIFSKKKLVVVSLSSKDLPKDKLVEHLKNEATYWKIKWGKDFAKKQQELDSEKEKEKEEDKIKYLIEQEKELKRKEFASVNLFKVFERIKKQKKGRKLQFTTFDGKKILGPVEAIGFSPTGLIECVSGKKVIWAGAKLKDVFYWVAGLGNYINKRIIPLCVDEHGRYTPNIMQEEIPQYVRTGDGKFILNRTNTKELGKYVADLYEDINGLNNELETKEEAIGEQQKEINDSKREGKLHRDRADKIQSELSEVMERMIELDKANGFIVRQNMTLMTLKETSEDLIDSYEKVISKVMDKLEKEYGTTLRDKEWEDLKEKVQFSKENLGNITQILSQKEEKPSLTEVRPVKV